MIIDSGRLKKWVVMCRRAGRKYVLERAQTIRMSLSTRDTWVGTRERRATARKIRTLDMENATVRRMRSGMGSEGDVTRIEGIPSSRVMAFNDAIMGRSCDTGMSWDNASGFGEAAKKTKGRMRPTATATDNIESVLKERDIELLAVEMGGVLPFKEAYKESVGDDVKAKAVAVIPCQKIPSLSQPELSIRSPRACATATKQSHNTYVAIEVHVA